MARPASQQPTPREFSILEVLWSLGPSTVRQVFDVLSKKEDLAYTTVLTTLQIMTDKGWVTRDTRQRSHIYQAAQSQEATQTEMVGDLLERVFSGSAMSLVTKALDAKPASQDDIEALQTYLDTWREQEEQ